MRSPDTGTNQQYVLTGSNNVRVKSKHVSGCISVKGFGNGTEKISVMLIILVPATTHEYIPPTDRFGVMIFT